jgi:hypothetical protein
MKVSEVANESIFFHLSHTWRNCDRKLFTWSRDITSVIVPTSIESLELACFRNFLFLSEVTFARISSVKIIGSRSFRVCSSFWSSLHSMTHKAFCDAFQYLIDTRESTDVPGSFCRLHSPFSRRNHTNVTSIIIQALLSRPWCFPSIDIGNAPAKVTFLFPIRLKLFHDHRPLIKSL